MFSLLTHITYLNWKLIYNNSIHTHVHMYVCMHVCIHTHTCMHGMCICLCACVAGMYVCVHVYIWCRITIQIKFYQNSIMGIQTSKFDIYKYTIHRTKFNSFECHLFLQMMISFFSG